MKKPQVNYSNFTFSKLFTPEFSHLLLLSGWVVYFLLYFLTENLIPIENCHPIHSYLDDIIPFCEWFVLPYVFWYALIVISLWYFALYNVTNFKRLQVYIMITQALAMAVYIIYPSCQNLRPEAFPRENILSSLVGFLYAFDTNTGVFPSLHCAYSLGIASVWLREKSVSRWWKAFVVVAVVLICLSTMFIKQHSALDFFGAIPVCLVAEYLVFFRFFPQKSTK